MDAITFIRQALTQAHERLMATLGGLTDADAAWRPAPRATAILELAWHVARVDDRLGRRATGLGPELHIDFIRGLRHPGWDLTPGTGIVQR